ncbi:MAG TPA: hypothetical protein VMT56_00385 [Candidatus Bathyarchaeia archaeon]|nr:hypothetical protein [Candidatus Bathyarchaeia archaeon]
MWKSLASELWTRIFLSYKSTIVGLLCAVGVVLVDWATNVLSQYHWALAPSLAVILAAVGAALKSKAQADLGSLPPPIAPVTPSPGSGSVPPKASAAVLGLLCLILSMPGLVRADETTVSTDTGAGFLTVQLDKDWSLHLNVTTVAYMYSLSTHVFVGEANVGGLYMLDYKGKFAFGGGLSFATGGPASSFVGNLAAASPRLNLTPQESLRLALIGQGASRAGKWQWGIGIGPLYEF